MSIRTQKEVSELKQHLVDTITSDLGLVLDNETEIKEMLYLAYIIGESNSDYSDPNIVVVKEYSNAVDVSTEILINFNQE